MTNRIIAEGRRVIVHEFESLSDAKKNIPRLRAYEERIVGRVRVVEVDGYDYSACLSDHVENTRECDFFIITSVSKAGDVYELKFQVGDKAKQVALELSRLCLRVSEILGATPSTLERTVLNLKEESLRLRQRLSSLTIEQATQVKPVEKFGLKFYVKVFEGLEKKKLMDLAGKIIKQERSIVIFGNKDDPPLLIITRSQDVKIDCASILRALSRLGGKGGGKAEYAFGTVPKDGLEGAIKIIQEAVEGELERAEKL
ncbi:MAG: DHHA1 domain-containing protein [Nitrososphaerota archaeon]